MGAQDVQRGVETCNEEQTEVKCNNNVCGTNEFTYQFVTQGVRKSGRVDIVESCLHVCVAGNTLGDTTPKCPYTYCDLEEGCQCCRSAEWAAPEHQSRVNVCAPKCASASGSMKECHRDVAANGSCVKSGAGLIACRES